MWGFGGSTHFYLTRTSFGVGREEFKLFGSDGFFHLPQAPVLMLVAPGHYAGFDLQLPHVKSPSLPRTVKLTPRTAGVGLSLVSKLGGAGLWAVACLATSPVEKANTQGEAERRNRGETPFLVLHAV